MSALRVIQAGAALAEARKAVVMVHGRGSNAGGILAITSHLPTDVAYIAPEASSGTWYPQRFLVPRAHNEPQLSAALGIIGATVQSVVDAGMALENVLLLGFSQGACLALEFAMRHPARYGGVIGLSGGLIGADAELNGYTGSLTDVPVFMGCSDVDFHIPLGRVEQSAQLMTMQGALVTLRIYPDFGHTINTDEIEHIRAMLA